MSSGNAIPGPSNGPMAPPEPSSAFLRRRSGQMNDSPPMQSGNIPTIASRRPATRAMTQNDWSLSLTSLTTPPGTPPMLPTLSRATTPTPAASSPLTTPFGKKRAADEIKAVTDMLNGAVTPVTTTTATEFGTSLESSMSSGIQRPASAPPRGRRSRRPSRELNDAGVDAMEKAPLPSTREVPTTISGIASETIEQFAAHLSDRSLAMLFMFIVAWGAVLSLDRLTTYSYQTIATNSFSHHSSLAEVNVIRSVVAAVAALPFASIADLGGRAQAFTLGLLLYAAGHAAMAGSTTIPSYIGGVVLYESGANGLICLQATVLADMTSSRNRLFFQIVPQMPFLVFSFISSDIYSAILPRWRWGIGMFAILGPAALLPVIAILGHSQHKNRANNVANNRAQSASQNARRASLQQTETSLTYGLLMIKHVWQTSDVLGLLLLVAALCLTLIPLTLAASAPNQWETPRIIGMICSGVVALGLFGVWELKIAKNALIPRVLFKNRTFWGGALGLTGLWTSHALMLAYFPTYLYVVHGVSNRAQQNFSVIYSFTVAAASLPIAMMVRHSRRFKIFTIVGVIVFTAGLGMMIGYKGTADSNFELAASQVIIGLGGALTIAVIQAAVQVSVVPAYVAQSIAALNIFPCIGNAIGAAVAGAIWTGLLPGKLARNLGPTGHLNELPTIFAEPLTWIESHGLGSNTRTAVVNAYSSSWRVMMIVATLISAVSLLPILYTENLRLNDSLSAEEAIGDDDMAYSGAIKPSKLVTQSGRLFGDSLFERMENALGRKLVRRLPKKVMPDSPTDLKTTNMPILASASSSSQTKRAHSSKWSNAWGALRNSSIGGSMIVENESGENKHIPTPTLVVDHGTPSPILSESNSPAPILVVDEAPYEPPLNPPTPPSRSSIGSLSPLPSPMTPFTNNH
ncbi:hypothetical protein L7F22_068272 [Adiantum nelumboides]|nr:hypothetical protein [Adiantum nelumboides]